jgi:hypothetical protein
MVKNSRKAFTKRKGTQVVDFRRAKVKVGRKLKPKNSTDTSFQAGSISLSGQRAIKEKGDVVTKRNLNVKDLLLQLSHHNSNKKKDALWGLKEITAVHEGVVLSGDTLGQILVRSVELVVDNDAEVRKALMTLLGALLKHVEPSAGASFMKLFVAYIGSAMTNLESDVRVDAVDFSSLLLGWSPASICAYETALLPNYIALVKGCLVMHSASSSVGFSIDGPSLKKQGARTKKKEFKQLNKLYKVVRGVLEILKASIRHGGAGRARERPGREQAGGLEHVNFDQTLPPLYCRGVGGVHRAPTVSIEQLRQSRIGSGKNKAAGESASPNISSVLNDLFAPLHAAWEYAVAFLGEQQVQGNARRSCSLDQARMVLQTLCTIARGVSVCIERFQNVDDHAVGPEVKRSLGASARKFFSLVMESFPFRRKGIMEQIESSEVSTVNAALCHVLLHIDAFLTTSSAGSGGSNDNDDDDDSGRWRVPIANFLAESYRSYVHQDTGARVPESMEEEGDRDGGDGRAVRDGGGSGIVALVRVLPSMLFRLEGEQLGPVCARLTSMVVGLPPSASAVLGPCLAVLHDALLAILDSGLSAKEAGFDPDATIMVWVKVLPKLIWKLGKNGDAENVSTCLSILQLILVASAGESNLLGVDRSVLDGHVSKMVAFFYTRSAANVQPKREAFGPFFQTNDSLQAKAISMLYYFPTINRFLLRALTVCVNRQGVSKQNKQLILDIMYHRRGEIGPAMYLSFLVSALLDPNNASSSDKDGKVETANRVETIRSICYFLDHFLVGESVFSRALLDHFVQHSSSAAAQTQPGGKAGIDLYALSCGMVASLNALRMTEGLEHFDKAEMYVKQLATVLVTSLGVSSQLSNEDRVAPLRQMILLAQENNFKFPATAFFVESFAATVLGSLEAKQNLDICQFQLQGFLHLVKDPMIQHAWNSNSLLAGFTRAHKTLMVDSLVKFLAHEKVAGLHTYAETLMLEVEILRPCS